jgi:hypothetical protein
MLGLLVLSYQPLFFSMEEHVCVAFRFCPLSESQSFIYRIKNAFSLLFRVLIAHFVSVHNFNYSFFLSYLKLALVPFYGKCVCSYLLQKGNSIPRCSSFHMAC